MPASGKTHIAVAATSKGVVEEINLPTPSPGKDEVLIRVAYAALMSFDTYQVDYGYLVQDYPVILGFNASGTVVEVGEGVNDLRPGDRVAAFTFQSRGAQQYSAQPRSAVSKIPDSLDLLEASTIPDNFVTSFGAFFHPDNIGLPIPSSFPPASPPQNANTPILVYGAGATTGQYAIQNLAAAGYRNIIATASSRHHAYLKTLGAAAVFDYNSPTLVEDIAQYVGGDGKVQFVMDCITSTGTLSTIGKLVSETGKVSILLPVKQGNSLRPEDDAATLLWDIPEPNPLPKGTKHYGVKTIAYAENEYLRDNLLPKILPQLLADGRIQPNKLKLIDQGTLRDRVLEGLDLLRNGKLSGEKVVLKVEA